MALARLPRRALTVLSVVALWSSFWRRSWKHRLGRLAVVALYGYLGMLVVLLWLENRLLFRACTEAEEWYPPPTGLHVEDVDLTSSDGTRTTG